MSFLPLLIPLGVFASKEIKKNMNKTKIFTFIILFSMLVTKIIETQGFFSFWTSLALCLFSYALFTDLFLEKFNVYYPIFSLIILLLTDLDKIKVIFLIIVFIVLFLASKFNYISNGEPYLIVVSLYMVSIVLWIPFIFMCLISALIYLIVFKNKTDSVPLGPFLLFSLLIFL